MIIPTLAGVTDSTGHSGVVVVRDIEKVVGDRDDKVAVLCFKDGHTLPVRAEGANRLLKCLPELDSTGARIC